MDMTTITFWMVSLLILERIGHYLLMVNQSTWKTIWFYIRFWKPIKKSISKHFLKNYPEISDDLDLYWSRESHKQVFDTEEKKRINHSHSDIMWKIKSCWTDQDKEDFKEYERLYKLWMKVKFQLKLDYLKTHHSTYYWLHKLKLI